MSENMRIYEKVRTVPNDALKQITGGRLKGMSDINPMWRIKMLTEMFGICGIGWKVEIVDKRLERGEGVEVVCFVDINLYVKVDGEWSAPIPGMGGSSFVTQERNGPFTSDECFKMAYTDAISVACKSLGFAADVYYGNDRTKYSQAEGNASRIPQRPVQTHQQQEQSYSGGQEHNASQAPTNGVRMISESQRALIKKLVNQKGISDEEYREMIAPKQSTKDLTSFEASKLIEKLTRIVAA